MSTITSTITSIARNTAKDTIMFTTMSTNNSVISRSIKSGTKSSHENTTLLIRLLVRFHNMFVEKSMSGPIYSLSSIGKPLRTLYNVSQSKNTQGPQSQFIIRTTVNLTPIISKYLQ
jgi:hypothetical protein